VIKIYFKLFDKLKKLNFCENLVKMSNFKTPVKDTSKALFEYNSSASNKLKDVTAQGPIGSLFARSNSKVQKTSENNFVNMKVDSAIKTISDDVTEPIIDLSNRRMSLGGLKKPL
jgi:hypothetical protein